VGIGGIGMSGIAELLANLGYVVSGSDAKASDVTRRLASLGVRVCEGHAATHVGDADVVVVSSAVRPSNPEVQEARARKIPVIPRAEMLAELMRLRYGIAVAGAHGKTTTTSMTALVLERGGLDPTAVIGGRLSAFGSNARLGQGDYMVAEADESDGSFLKLSPTIAVITNVDEEHLDHYQTFDNVLAAFTDFANKVPFYGAVVACADDPRLRGLLPRITRRIVTYGLDSPESVVVGQAATLEAFGSRCTVLRRAQGRADAPHETLGDLHLHVPGRHNLLNALAAVAVGLELGLGFDRIAQALAEFKGAERRFDVLGEVDGVMVVDDYGHHPTEIAAVLAAARAGMSRRLLVAFQPHRYTRTQQLLREFGDVLRTVDELVLTDIYGAGEDPIPGVTVEALVAEITRGSATATGSAPAASASASASVGSSSTAQTSAAQTSAASASRGSNSAGAGTGSGSVHIVHAVSDVPVMLAQLARPGDIVITLGAGSIGTVGPRLLQLLRDGEPAHSREPEKGRVH
jgi:UDP-N-acetylmuramate--alanine ligase